MYPIKINQHIEIAIANIGNNGEGVGSHEGYTLFVEGALPGDIVKAVVIEVKKRYGRARLLSIIKSSPDRVSPLCPLFGKCGGCQLMHLRYTGQLDIKRQKVIDALQRIGKFDQIDVAPCIASPSPLEYRNKIQLPFRMTENGPKLGLYAASSHQLIDVEKCYIHCSLGEQIYQEIRKIIGNTSITPYDPATGKGELRHVLIKSAVHLGQALVILVSNGAATPLLSSIANEIASRCIQVKGVIHNLNTNQDNVILGKKYKTLWGSSHIQETLSGMIFKVSPASFFQVNAAQAECLYAKAVEFAALNGDEVVLDAYCGVGTLSLNFARLAKKVIGIECVSEAIVDAKENAQLNGIKNVHFFCAEAEKWIANAPTIDVAILNPPRKGCDISFLDGIKKLLPKKIVYISCDPATLARDLAILANSGYSVGAVQPFDMFPQTSHVECVCVLNKAHD